MDLKVKFRLKSRKLTGSLRLVNVPNALITMRIAYKSARVELSTGLHVDSFRWDDFAQVAIGPNRDGMSADQINASMMSLVKNAQDTVEIFESQHVIPTSEQFKETFERLRSGETVSLQPPKARRKPQKSRSEVADITCSKQDKTQSKSQINTNLEKTRKGEINKSLPLWEVAVEFENVCGRQNNWTESTHEKFRAMRNHLKGLRDYKRKRGLKTFDLNFDYFDDEGMLSYLEYLRDVKNMKNTTIEKNMEFLRWFLRWSLQKGFHKNGQFESFRPKFKKTQRKVIFLTKKEIKKLENYKIPETKLYLYRVRDVFLFCCYTGLRYSDVYNLKKYDVKSDHIEVTTMKTFDSLKIELNDVSRRILDKYKSFDLPNNKALPVINNSKMNKYLHELCEMAGFDEPIRQTYYKGNERIDVVKPKYELIGTHTGRRTFICNALGMGIPPQVVMKWTGHSDYKAMKPYIDVADEIKIEAMKKFNEFCQ